MSVPAPADFNDRRRYSAGLYAPVGRWRSLAPSITRPIHSSGREIERCEVCNGMGRLTASLH